jgi:hypothetical protein
MKNEQRGGNPKKIKQVIEEALQVLRPATTRFQNIEYNLPSTKAPVFTIGLN